MKNRINNYEDLKNQLLENEKVVKVSKKGDYIKIELNATDYTYPKLFNCFNLLPWLLGEDEEAVFFGHTRDELEKVGDLTLQYISAEAGQKIDFWNHILYSITYKIVNRENFPAWYSEYVIELKPDVPFFEQTDYKHAECDALYKIKEMGLGGVFYSENDVAIFISRDDLHIKIGNYKNYQEALLEIREDPDLVLLILKDCLKEIGPNLSPCFQDGRYAII